MRDDLKARIDSVCQAQATAHQTRRDRESDLTLHRSELLDRFIALRRNVIRPVMQEFVCYLSDQFYACRIIDDDHHTDQLGRRAYRASVTLRLYKGAEIGDELKFVPHYSIMWDDVNHIVRFARSNTTKCFAGEAGYDGKSDIHDVTADLIESKLLAFTSWVFKDQSV